MCYSFFFKKVLNISTPPEPESLSESDERDLQLPPVLDIQPLCSASLLSPLLPHCYLWHHWEYSHDHINSPVGSQDIYV